MTGSGLSLGVLGALARRYLQFEKLSIVEKSAQPVEIFNFSHTQFQSEGG
jgi:hypothetical protein